MSIIYLPPAEMLKPDACERCGGSGLSRYQWSGDWPRVDHFSVCWCADGKAVRETMFQFPVSAGATGEGRHGWEAAAFLPCGRSVHATGWNRREAGNEARERAASAWRVLVNLAAGEGIELELIWPDAAPVAIPLMPANEGGFQWERPVFA